MQTLLDQVSKLKPTRELGLLGDDGGASVGNLDHRLLRILQGEKKMELIIACKRTMIPCTHNSNVYTVVFAVVGEDILKANLGQQIQKFAYVDLAELIKAEGHSFRRIHGAHLHLESFGNWTQPEVIVHRLENAGDGSDRHPRLDSYRLYLRGELGCYIQPLVATLDRQHKLVLSFVRYHVAIGFDGHFRYISVAIDVDRRQTLLGVDIGQ